VITVPVGFVTDYASIPRAFCEFLPEQGRYSGPAIIHDFLYWKAECTQAQADKIMFVAMTDAGVSDETRDTIYRALVRFGKPAFESNAHDRADGLPRVIPVDYRNIPYDQSWPEYRKFLRARGVPVDPREPVPPAYCAAGEKRFDEIQARKPKWWEFWKWWFWK